MVEERGEWKKTAGAEGHIVLQSSVRIARNLASFPFPKKAGKKELESVIAQVREALLMRGAALSQSMVFVSPENLSEAEAVSLVERRLASPEFISSGEGRALLLSEDGSISILINEEDHLRIQVLRDGPFLEEAARQAGRIDTLLGESLQFAFDRELGYLTQRLSDLGTGMRVMTVLHLPGLAETGAMERIAANLSKLGLDLRGAWREGGPAAGAQYQLSNQLTLGIGEEDAVQNLAEITRQLADQELAARLELAEDVQIQDRVTRGVGVLQSARLLSTQESRKLLSAVRFGLSTGMLDGMTPSEITRLELECQPATLTVAAGKPLSQHERDLLRAQRVREACSRIALK